VAERSQPGELDAVDQAILRLLTEDARRTFGDIGAAVRLSAPAVKRRIDRLEASGVIRGYTTVVDHAKLGRPLEAFVELRFSGNARVDAIANIGTEIPEVAAVFTVAGDPDALVWIRVRDVQDLKQVVDKLRATGDVTGTKTMMVLGTRVSASAQTW
jgi:Lrp/AsnC family leucine-responsive transcriptional regulator